MFTLEGRSLQIAITVSSGSAYLLFGYDQGVLGGLVSDPSFLSAMGNPSSTYLGIIVALFNIGCLGGCLVAALWGNDLGRKKTIIWGCITMIVGGVVQASSYGSGQLIAGRIISGIGNGMNTSTVPVYISETSRSTVRGRSLAIQMSIVIFGTVVAYWLDYGMIRNHTGEVVWRFPLAFQDVFALITVATMPFLPESPRWSYSKGRKQEAVRALALLMDLSEDDHEVVSIVSEMEQAVSLEQSNAKLTFRNIFLEKTEMKNGRRLALCFLLQLFQQFTGINVIAFYVTIVLETNVGLSRELSSLVAGCIQIAFWVGTFPPIFLMDRLGRRKTLMFGSTMLCLAMVLFTVGVALETTASSRLALGMLIIYEISFGMSWNSVPWLYAPEITPLNLRHLGAAVCCFSEWLWTFVIALMTPTAIENTGWKIYLLFCIMLALSIPFVYFFMPETNGKTLEEIDYIFVKGRNSINSDPSLSYDTPSVELQSKVEGKSKQVEHV
ncbi:general substrate transporter [Aspergillus karnatakaensis]|uniref:sugar porter family MFS transporter n=1 Tax=Aspergillus karnatakaensis TaxID=1810916 RepID=UPI003CCCD7DD